jgi:hypothetical protein
MVVDDEPALGLQCLMGVLWPNVHETHQESGIMADGI